VKETLTTLSLRARLLEIVEVEVKSIAVRSIALGACVSIPAIALAQEFAPQTPGGYHHTVHHHVHNGQHYHVHRFEAHNPAVAPAAAAATAAPQAAPFGLSWPRIAPYPDSKGDEDGLSGNTDDCNKGCVGGAPD
jgi:hypothetical protein